MSILRSNSYLTEEERERSSLAYFGYFFANLDFDDGFRHCLLNPFLNYLNSLKYSDIKLEIQQTEPLLRVKIKCREILEGTQQKIFDLTMEIQRDFYLTPITQIVGYGIQQSNPNLPIIVEAPHKKSIGYNRYLIQKQQAEILKAQEDISILESKIAIIENTLNNNEIINKLKEQIKCAKNMLKTYKENFAKMVANIYLNTSVNGSLTKGGKETYVSSMKAAAILDLNGIQGDEKANRMNKRLKEMEEIFNKSYSNFEKAINGSYSDLEATIERLNLQMLEHSRDLTRLVNLANASKDGKSKNTNTNKTPIGFLGNLTENNEGELLKAVVIGEERPSVFFNEVETVGFPIEDFESIFKILNMHKNQNGTLVSGDIIFSSKKVGYFYMGNTVYKYLEIESEKSFDSITIEKKDENGKPVCGCVELNSEIRYFYTKEDGEYAFLSIEGEKIFFRIEIEKKDENGKPVCGCVELNGKRRYFFMKKDGGYVFLSVEGKNSFDSIDIEKTNENGKPVYGYVELDGKRKYFFMKKDGEYAFLSIEGIESFDSLEIGEKDKNGRVIYGYAVFNKKRIYFYTKEDGKYAFLNTEFSIEGEKNFDSIYIIEKKDENGKPVCGCVELNGERIYFYTKEDGEYVFFSIEGEKNFDRVNIKEKDENGKPVCGNVELEGKERYFYTKEDGGYVYGKLYLDGIDGEKVLYFFKRNNYIFFKNDNSSNHSSLKIENKDENGKLTLQKENENGENGEIIISNGKNVSTATISTQEKKAKSIKGKIEKIVDFLDKFL